MTYLIIVTNKETKEEKQVYCFNYIELLNLLPRINPELSHIQITEVENVYDLHSFISTDKNLVPDEYWTQLGNYINKLTDYLDDEKENPFGLN